MKPQQVEGRKGREKRQREREGRGRRQMRRNERTKERKNDRYPNKESPDTPWMTALLAKLVGGSPPKI